MSKLFYIKKALELLLFYEQNIKLLPMNFCSIALLTYFLRKLYGLQTSRGGNGDTDISKRDKFQVLKNCYIDNGKKEKNRSRAGWKRVAKE